MRPHQIIQILLLSAVWGISFLMMRIAVVAFPPVWISMLRCALGAGLLWMVLLLGRKKLPPRDKAPWLLLVALLNNAIPFSFFAWGERSVPSNIAAVINATVPIWTVLFAVAFHHARPRLRVVAGVLLAFGGVIWVVAAGNDPPTPHETSASMGSGVLIISLAAVSYAVATLVAKQRLQGLDPIGLATTQLTLATAMLLPIALGGAHPAGLQPGPIAAVAVLGFAGSGIAYLLYYRLLQEVSATQLVGVTYLMPLWGLFWGLVAHEPVGFYAYCGVATTIVGLVLMNMRESRAR